MSGMKVAILHDYLNQWGGAERVLKAILELYPDADLYTLLYDPARTRGIFTDRNIRTSFLDVPFVRRRHRAFIPLMPFAARALRSREPYDLVISSAAGYGKGINVKGRYHICYCHSPLRYAWEFKYLKDVPFAPWPLKETMLYPIARALREWDRSAAKYVDLFIANSAYIAGKIRACYGREATVVYPPVDTTVFCPNPGSTPGDYYLMAGRLIYWKRFDLGIEVMNRLHRPLLVVGAGPEEEKLKKLARNGTVRFARDVSDEELRGLYSHARALIFPQVEDFGLVAAEAQACGCPIIAYREGGGGEIVAGKETGVLFGEQTPEALMDAVRTFEGMRFDRSVIARSAARFSKEQFRERFLDVVRGAGLGA